MVEEAPTRGYLAYRGGGGTEELAYSHDLGPTEPSLLDWLEAYDIRLLNWLPYSLDLNPIEYAWLALKRTLYKLYLEFNTMGDTVEEWVAFEAGLKEAWAAIPDSLLKKLILSMPDRLAACKAAKGY
ncbi:hypothetical protein GQ44DRAFT_765376 [Phaeosphaeriaceae sp. PMI808]|nr:hypothetical protein GQ44DRAFT_765376 [Phaeosphaeriaceae sp. PMI808]